MEKLDVCRLYSELTQHFVFSFHAHSLPISHRHQGILRLPAETRSRPLNYAMPLVNVRFDAATTSGRSWPTVAAPRYVSIVHRPERPLAVDRPADHGQLRPVADCESGRSTYGALPFL